MPSHSVRALPFPALCDDMLNMLVCATRWLSLHLYMLSYMSMHESCFLVCRPCFSTMKLWTFDLNLHLSLIDITFCVLSCLFALQFMCLLSHVLCLPCLSCLSASCPFHMLFAYFSSTACLPVSCLCLYMYAHGARMLGARARTPRHKQKGRGHEHLDMSQATVASRFRALVFPIWLCTPLNPSLPPPFLSQMGCIRYIMLCTILSHLQSMATPIYFPALIFWAMFQGCRHLLSYSVCLHCA